MIIPSEMTTHKARCSYRADKTLLVISIEENKLIAKLAIETWNSKNNDREREFLRNYVYDQID